jgi:Zn finger protein HypA/HybF involved in hydrogenase expression
MSVRRQKLEFNDFKHKAPRIQKITAECGTCQSMISVTTRTDKCPVCKAPIIRGLRGRTV